MIPILEKGDIILWCTDPLLGRDLETNDTTAIFTQQCSKHASTTTELTVGNSVFYLVREKVLS
jgi:hypothetical protein